MSKARNLANFISNPTVEATEIANGAITADKIANTAVTADKLHTTLDLSGKTLTLANNHLSGDNIHGGLISDFQSTGIDDNATNTAITISTSKDVTFTNNVAAAYFSGDGSQLTGLPPGYTNSDVAAYLANNDYDTATNIIAEISNSAPTTLDTLNELAAALGDDANFAATTSTSLGNRLRIDTNAQGLTSAQKTNAVTNLGLATVASSGAYSDLTGTPTIPTNNNQLTNGAGYATLSGATFTGNITRGSVTLGGSGTIAGATWGNGEFHLGSASQGWAMDPNELYNASAAIIGTISGDLDLNPAGNITTSRPFVSTGTISSGTITSDGVLRGTTTTGAGTPTFSFDGDTNTGMYHVQADVIGFTTGGTERARISNEGLQLANAKIIRFDNTSDSNYDVTLGSYYDFDAWFQVKSGEGTTRFSVGRDNNAYLGGAGSAGNRVLTQADEGSGNGLDADTVDGLQASQFLRADASDTTTGSLTVNGDIIVDEIRARSSQDLCITAGESRTHLTDGTYNDEYIRLAAESGVIAYASSDNLTSGLNRNITLINNAGHTITGGTLNCSAGLIVGQISSTATFTSANDAGSMSIRGDTTKPAVVSFHRAGAYAVQFGLDTDNHLKMGGWSASTIKHTWQNNGSYLATGNITAYSSDKRLKTNVVNIPNALNKVMSLNGVTFDWKEEVQELGFEPTRMTDEIGVLAQEVEAVIPQATAPAPFDLENDNGKTISKSGENYLTVQYEKIVPLLIEAIKEQQAQIEELKKKIQE